MKKLLLSCVLLCAILCGGYFVITNFAPPRGNGLGLIRMPVLVIDQNSGNPIAGAKIVTLCMGSDTSTNITDSNGCATVIAFDGPVRALNVNAPGYSNVSIAVTSRTATLALSKIHP